MLLSVTINLQRAVRVTMITSEPWPYTSSYFKLVVSVMWSVLFLVFHVKSHFGLKLIMLSSNMLTEPKKALKCS